jgi:hypothetical protein
MGIRTPILEIGLSEARRQSYATGSGGTPVLSISGLETNSHPLRHEMPLYDPLDPPSIANPYISEVRWRPSAKIFGRKWDFPLFRTLNGW